MTTGSENDMPLISSATAAPPMDKRQGGQDGDRLEAHARTAAPARRTPSATPVPMAMPKLVNSSFCSSTSPVSTRFTPWGRVLQGGQGVDLLHRLAQLHAVQVGLERHAAALVVAAHARGALAERDIRDRLQRHRAARRGGHRQILERRQIRRASSSRLTRIGTCRSLSENFAAFCGMSPSVAIRTVWLML